MCQKHSIYILLLPEGGESDTINLVLTHLLFYCSAFLKTEIFSFTKFLGEVSAKVLSLNALW